MNTNIGEEKKLKKAKLMKMFIAFAAGMADFCSGLI